MTKSGSQKNQSPAQLIDARIKQLGDWRGEILSRLRKLIKGADLEVVEEANGKSRRTPWTFRSGSTPASSAPAKPRRTKVKLTFAEGALLADPSGLFNASLEGNVRRAIDFHAGDKIDERA